MYNRLGFFLLVVSIIFTLGCPLQETEKATSSLVFQLPGNSKALPTQNDVASYSVTVKNDDLGYNVTKTGSPGSSMSFTGLIVGLYQVNVEASDASTKVIFVGSSEVEIEYNTNKSILIQLDYATGDITIGFTFPTEEPTIEPTAIPTPTAEPTIEPTAEPTVTPVPTNVTVEKIGTEHIVTIPISNQDFTVEIYYNEDPFPPMLPRTDFFVGIDLNASIPDIDPGDTITFRVEFLNPLMVNRNDVPYIAFSLGCTYAGCMIPSYEYNIIPDGNIALSVGNAGCYMTCPAETGTIDGFWFNMNTTQEPLIEGAILNGFTASFIVPTTLAHENGTTCLSSITCSTVYQSDERSNPLPFVLLD